MLRALRGVHRLRDPAAMRVWLFRITVNLWKDRLRRRRRTPRSNVLEIDQADDGSASLPAKIVQKEDLQRAMQALDELPQRQRDVMYLHVCEGLPLRETAKVLGIGYGAVKASLAFGRKSLRNTLKDIYVEVDGAAKP